MLRVPALRMACANGAGANGAGLVAFRATTDSLSGVLLTLGLEHLSTNHSHDASALSAASTACISTSGTVSTVSTLAPQP